MRLDVPAVWILKSPRIMTGERETDSKPGAEISEERVGKTRRTGGDHSKRSGGELQSMSFSDFFSLNASVFMCKMRITTPRFVANIK